MQQATAPGGTYLQVTSGGSHSCAIDANQNISCWGNNNNNQTNAPGGLFVQLNAGIFHNCAVDSSGAVQCWGVNGDGQCTPPEEYIVGGVLFGN